MTPTIRMTMPTLAVLDRLAAARDDDPVWGLRICEDLGLGPGTVYPILERLTEAGWTIGSWEDDRPSGRPRRRYYQLSGTGRAARASAWEARERRGLRWRPNPGAPQ